MGDSPECNAAASVVRKHVCEERSPPHSIWVTLRSFSFTLTGPNASTGDAVSSSAAAADATPSASCCWAGVVSARADRQLDAAGGIAVAALMGLPLLLLELLLLLHAIRRACRLGRVLHAWNGLARDTGRESQRACRIVEGCCVVATTLLGWAVAVCKEKYESYQ